MVLPLSPFVDDAIAAPAPTSTSCSRRARCTFVQKLVSAKWGPGFPQAVQTRAVRFVEE